MKTFLQADAFFNLSSFEHRDLFAGTHYVWEALGNISSHVKAHLRSNVRAVDCFRRPLPETVVIWNGKVWRNDFELLDGDVAKGTFRVRIEGEETTGATVLYAGSVLWDDQILLGPGAAVEPGALIKGPTIVGAHTEVRQGAYIRGKCIIGDRCIVGHTTEMKSSVMLNEAKAGHFAYLGDSILGHACNLGAGTKLANLKIKGDTVRIRVEGESIDTGLRKFGAIIGDQVEIGCNTVTNPGTLLGQSCLVLPLTSVPAGYHAPKRILRPGR